MRGPGRGVLAATALLLGGLASGLGDPPSSVAPLELARWLRDRRVGLEVIDLRDQEEFDRGHVAGARRVAMADWPALLDGLAGDPQRVVVLTTPQPDALRAMARRSRGSSGRLYVSAGGVEGWRAEVLSPVLAPDASPAEVAEFAQIAALSRYFGGSPRIGEAGAATGWRRGC